MVEYLVVAAGTTDVATKDQVWVAIAVAVLATLGTAATAWMSWRAAQATSGSGPFATTASANADFQMHKRKVYGELLGALEVYDSDQKMATRNAALKWLGDAQLAAAPEVGKDLRELRELLKDGRSLERERLQATIDLMAADARLNQ